MPSFDLIQFGFVFTSLSDLLTSISCFFKSSKANSDLFRLHTQCRGVFLIEIHHENIKLKFFEVYLPFPVFE